MTALHPKRPYERSEEHTSELQSQSNLVCRLVLEKKKQTPHLCLGLGVAPSHYLGDSCLRSGLVGNHIVDETCAARECEDAAVAAHAFRDPQRRRSRRDNAVPPESHSRYRTSVLESKAAPQASRHTTRSIPTHAFSTAVLQVPTD